MYRLKCIGKLKARCAADFKESRLGIGLEKLDRAVFDPSKVYDKLASIGIKRVRIQSGWQRTEKTRGVYDFSWLDEIVDNLLARGMQPWMCLCYGNGLYDDTAKTVFGAVGCPPVHTDEQRNAWYNYVQATVTHFKGRVKEYEIWNEPDEGYAWKSGVNATEFGNLTVWTAAAIRKADPNAYIMGGAISKLYPGEYFNEALRTGMADVIDAISFHEYVYDDRNVIQKVKGIRGFANLYNPNLDIVQGETGAPSRPGGHGGVLAGGSWTFDKQARWLLRNMTADLIMGVKFTSYFSSVNMIEAHRGLIGNKATYMDYGYFGVLSSDFDDDGFPVGNYTPNPSYYALQNMCAVLGGVLENIDLPIFIIEESAKHTGYATALKSSDITYGGFKLDNGSYAMAYWYPTELMTSTYEGSISVQASIPGEVHLIDPFDGSVYELPEGILNSDKFGTHTLRNIPIKDYPMYLVFGELPELQ